MSLISYKHHDIWVGPWIDSILITLDIIGGVIDTHCLVFVESVSNDDQVVVLSISKLCVCTLL